VHVAQKPGIESVAIEEGFIPKTATPDVTEKTGTASDTYKKAFWNSIRNRNWIDVHDDLHIGTDAEGGYLVPDEFVRL